MMYLAFAFVPIATAGLRPLVGAVVYCHKQAPSGLMTSVPDAVYLWPEFHARVRI
jgi:hypothetical protein